jgi:rhodanese-related sulfurtransferase
MKYWIVLLMLILVACQSGKERHMDLLSPQEFADRMQHDPEVVILDVRTPAEVQAGVISHPTVMDFNNANFQQSLGGLDKSKKYLVYCASGKRSGKAQHMMNEMGFENVCALNGGMNAWIAAGLPVTSSH